MTYGVSGASSSSYANSSNNSSASDTVSKDEFLQLLTYQLQAQNPLKPYNNQEFATQLAQFSQLEQLTDIKSLIEEQNSTNNLLAETISNTALPGMLGKRATAYTNKFNYDGENEVQLGFSLPYNAESGTLKIKDENGTIVQTLELNRDKLNSGDNYITWSGDTNEGSDAPKGNYSFEVNVTDNNGSGYSADTFIKGKIQAVRFKSEGTLLVINGQEITLNNIADISTNN